METMDKRPHRTEEAIRAAFFSMLEEIPVHKITVSELCRRANINRGTFYLHYQDCYDLMEALSLEIARRLTPHVQDICRDRGNLRDSILSILSILVEDKNIILLIQSSVFCSQIIRHHFRDMIQGNWKRVSGIDDLQADLAYAYISGGVFSAIQKMGTPSNRESADALSESVYKLIIEGLSAFVR